MCNYCGNIYISTDFGSTWTPRSILSTWINNGMSSTGQYICASDSGGNIYISSDYGSSFILSYTNKMAMGCIAVSSDGSHMVACENQNNTNYKNGIYASADYGNTWTYNTNLSTPSQTGISIDSTGQYIAVSIYQSKYCYISNDSGITFTETTI